MPDDKKNQQKGRSDAKDQRRPRQGRHKGGNVEKNVPLVETKAEVPKAPQKPVYEEPGPEFYKNLKRETDDILKITEEANTKYKKKEIQSNWTKYEMPIETYDEIEQQESMGADYEKLIQMPLSIGGHFQFKHEKSWDIGTAPSLYDKYFHINMDDLANALCTIPFYERNNIDKDIFSQTDIMTMDNRATKYKRKYYNDKSYTTTELNAQDKILSNLAEALTTSEPRDEQTNENEIDFKEKTPIETKIMDEKIPSIENYSNESKSKETEVEITFNTPKTVIQDETTTKIIKQDVKSVVPNTEINIDLEEMLSKNMLSVDPHIQKADVTTEKKTTTHEDILSLKPEKSKNPVIESPEDLEKWLDDFLDG